MIKHFLIFTLLFSTSILNAQETSVFDQHRLSIDFGSYRNKYLYSTTDIIYVSPLLQKVNIGFSTRLRSYGTLYFFSKSAYDIMPIVAYYTANAPKPLYFSIGIGADARLRIVHDVRSSAKSSIEPLVKVSLYATYKKISFTVPLLSKFYSNGIALSLQPELTVNLGRWFALFLRYEQSYLRVFGTSNYEWQRDSFIGATFRL